MQCPCKTFQLSTCPRCILLCCIVPGCSQCSWMYWVKPNVTWNFLSKLPRKYVNPISSSRVQGSATAANILHMYTTGVVTALFSSSTCAHHSSPSFWRCTALFWYIYCLRTCSSTVSSLLMCKHLNSIQFLNWTAVLSSKLLKFHKYYSTMAAIIPLRKLALPHLFSPYIKLHFIALVSQKHWGLKQAKT